MQHRPGMSSAGQDELTERRQFRLKRINCGFQRGDSLRRQPEFGTRLILETRIGKLCAYREQILLDGSQHIRKGGGVEGWAAGAKERAGGADKSVEFVDGAVGLDPVVVLADLRAVKQARIAAIAGLRVDLHERPSFVSVVSAGSQ